MQCVEPWTGSPPPSARRPASGAHRDFRGVRPPRARRAGRTAYRCGSGAPAWARGGRDTIRERESDGIRRSRWPEAGGSFLALLIALGCGGGTGNGNGTANDALSAASGASPAAPTVTVFASGLNNPRGLKLGPDGDLYLAEGGVGGSNGPAGEGRLAHGHRERALPPERHDLRARRRPLHLQRRLRSPTGGARPDPEGAPAGRAPRGRPGRRRGLIPRSPLGGTARRTRTGVRREVRAVRRLPRLPGEGSGDCRSAGPG